MTTTTAITDPRTEAEAMSVKALRDALRAQGASFPGMRTATKAALVDALVALHRAAEDAAAEAHATRSTSGSAIVSALEAAYEDIRAYHPELPPVVIITGSGLMAKGVKWGHYWRDAWVHALESGRLPEIFIAGERLECGPVEALETLIHEAVHALAVVRDVQDTSKEGRYHNGEFVKLAHELGLDTPEKPHPVIGYSDTSLPAETIARYVPTIERLAQAQGLVQDTLRRLGLVLGGGGTGGGGDARVPVKGPNGGRRVTTTDRNYAKAMCGCGRTIRVSRRTLAEAAITCGACGEPFVAPEVPEDTDA